MDNLNSVTAKLRASAEDEYVDEVVKAARETVIDRRLEQMRHVNAAVHRRHAEVEADKHQAEQAGHAVSLRSHSHHNQPTSDDGVTRDPFAGDHEPADRAGVPHGGRGRGPRGRGGHRGARGAGRGAEHWDSDGSRGDQLSGRGGELGWRGSRGSHRGNNYSSMARRYGGSGWNDEVESHAAVSTVLHSREGDASPLSPGSPCSETGLQSTAAEPNSHNLSSPSAGSDAHSPVMRHLIVREPQQRAENRVEETAEGSLRITFSTARPAPAAAGTRGGAGGGRGRGSGVDPATGRDRPLSESNSHTSNDDQQPGGNGGGRDTSSSGYGRQSREHVDRTSEGDGRCFEDSPRGGKSGFEEGVFDEGSLEHDPWSDGGGFEEASRGRGRGFRQGRGRRPGRVMSWRRGRGATLEHDSTTTDANTAFPRGVEHDAENQEDFSRSGIVRNDAGDFRGRGGRRGGGRVRRPRGRGRFGYSLGDRGMEHASPALDDLDSEPHEPSAQTDTQLQGSHLERAWGGTNYRGSTRAGRLPGRGGYMRPRSGRQSGQRGRGRQNEVTKDATVQGVGVVEKPAPAAEVEDWDAEVLEVVEYSAEEATGASSQDPLDDAQLSSATGGKLAGQIRSEVAGEHSGLPKNVPGSSTGKATEDDSVHVKAFPKSKNSTDKTTPDVSVDGEATSEKSTDNAAPDISGIGDSSSLQSHDEDASSSVQSCGLPSDGQDGTLPADDKNGSVGCYASSPEPSAGGLPSAGTENLTTGSERIAADGNGDAKPANSQEGGSPENVKDVVAADLPRILEEESDARKDGDNSASVSTEDAGKQCTSNDSAVEILGNTQTDTATVIPGNTQTDSATVIPGNTQTE